MRLGHGVCLAREAAGEGIAALGDRLAAVDLAPHEVADGDGVGRIWTGLSQRICSGCPTFDQTSSFTYQMGASGPMAADRIPFCAGVCSLELGVSGCRVSVRCSAITTWASGCGFEGSVLEHVTQFTACCKTQRLIKILLGEQRSNEVGEMLHISKSETESVTSHPLSLPHLARHSKRRRPCPIRVAGGLHCLLVSVPLRFPTSCMCP